MKKFSFEETVKFFSQYGFTVLDGHGDGVDTRLNIRDEEGYKYFYSRHNLYCQIKRLKSIDLNVILNRFDICNSHTIDNIILWIEKNNSTFIFHHGKYDGNDSRTLFFQCNKCLNVWDAQWTVIQQGKGCPYCGKKKFCYNNSLAKSRPDLIDEWDFEKNGDYTPHNIGPRSKKYFWWICSKCNHEWVASVANRNALTKEKSTNCPKCDRSSGELEVERILNIYNIDYIAEYAFEKCKYKNKLFFDFYLPELNCCIEYNGQQHYKPTSFWYKHEEQAEEDFKSLVLKDKIKEDFCFNNSILLIKIPYWDFNKIEENLVRQLGLTKNSIYLKGETI